MITHVRRTQIQLDEATYVALRLRAYQQRRSLAAVIRDVLSEALGTRARKKSARRTMKDFPFVGAGESDQGSEGPVSERHDQALAKGWRP
jgi:plasmid stability protein